MIIDLKDELGELEGLIGRKLTRDETMKIGLLFVQLIDRGMSMYRKRAVATVQKMAVNPLAIVRELNRPLR
jgi:hypothetical protein